MDSQTILMYTEFFQTGRDYLLHLQSLMLLLLTACAYLYFKIKNKKSRYIISTAFLFGVFNLIIGLCAYSKILNTILAIRSSPQEADLMQIGYYIWWQFFIGMGVLIAILLCAMRGQYENN